MIDLKQCPQCGVPEYISNEHRWLDNGDIVQARESWYRLLFIETENMEPLFRGIEEVVGTSVGDIVETATREAITYYLKLFIPKEIRELIQKKRIDPKPLGTVMADMAKMVGFGNHEVVGARYEQDEDDFVTMRISEPSFLPMVIASLAASVEVLHGCYQYMTSEEVSPGVFEVTARPDPHGKREREITGLLPYHPVRGDLEMEKCATCGVPKAVSEYQWDIDRGIILNNRTHRRMCFTSPQELNPIFQELEREFGKDIPQVVVEAQRRFTRSGFYSTQDLSDLPDFRQQLALRGLGNLKEMDFEGKCLRLRIANAALPLIIVGLVQGFFEMSYDVDSQVDWELSQQDDLEVEVRSR